VPKPTQPKIKMKHGNVQRVEDKAGLTSRWVGDFSKNRRRGHSMPPRSRKLKKSVKFFFRQQKKIKLILFYKKINFFIKIKIFFYFFNFEIKNFPLWIIFISMN
jgi:hypothetical protein